MIHISEGAITETSSSTAPSWPPSLSGNGVILTAKVHQLRNHTIIVKKMPKDDFHRYVVISLDVEYAKRRQFDSRGIEIEHVALDTKQAKGYLNQFDKLKGADKEKVDLDELRKIVGPPFYEKTKQHPAQQGRFELLGDANLIKGLALTPYQRIKLKTKGDSCLIEVITKEDERSHNYHGENVIDNFANRIEKGKGVIDNEKPLPTDNMEGAGSDEWD